MTEAEPPPVLLMNPNSNAVTTLAMVTIAKRFLPNIRGWTAPSGPAMLTTTEQLANAAKLLTEAKIPSDISGVIIAAFGDPGRVALAAKLNIPVVGIGQAAAIAAAKGKRHYCVVTHTPNLKTGIDALMQSSVPNSNYLGTFVTTGDPHVLSKDATQLDAALLAAIQRANAAGAEAIIIGGGPLAEAAERLKSHAPCALITPVPEAAQHMLSLLRVEP